MFSSDKKIAIVVGAPLRAANRLYNCAVVITGGKIIGAVPKIHLPNYNEFYERDGLQKEAGVNPDAGLILV